MTHAKANIAALCFVLAVPNAVCGGAVLWIDDLRQQGRLSSGDVGGIAALEQLSVAIGAALATSLPPRMLSRRFVQLFGLLLLLANVASTSAETAVLICGRVASGLAAGGLLAIATRLASRRPDAQRALALQAAAGSLLTMLLFLGAPTLLGHAGAFGLFSAFALAGLILAFAGAFLPVEVSSSKEAEQKSAEMVTPRVRLAPLIACFAVGLVMFGMQAVWSFSLAIGASNELNRDALMSVLAITPLLGFCGPIAAHAFGERAGLLAPTIVGFALAGFGLLLLPLASMIASFAIVLALLALPVAFAQPYATAFISSIDPSGKAVGAFWVASAVSGAAGVAIGGRLFAYGPFVLCAASAAIALAGVALFGAVGAQRRSANEVGVAHVGAPDAPAPLRVL